MSIKTSFRLQSNIESIYTGGKVEVSQDENYIVTPCNDKIKVISLANGEVVGVLEGDTEAITTLTLDPTGRFVVSSSASLQLKYWNLGTPDDNGKLDKITCVRTWKAHTAPILSLCFDRTSTLVASGGSSDNLVKVWDVEKGYCTHSFKGHTGVISFVTFHPNPQRLQLFSSSDDCTVRVWDLVSKSCAVLSNHMSLVTSMAFSKSGLELYTGGRDRILSVWNLRDNSLKKTIPVFEGVEAVAVHKEKKNENLILAVAGEKGQIKLWDAELGKCIKEEEKEPGSQYAINGLVVCEKNQRMYITTSDHNIVVYDSEKLKKEQLFVGYNDEIIDVKYISGKTQGSPQRIVVATNSETVRIFNLTENHSASCLSEMLAGHTDIVMCVDVTERSHHQGPLVATGSKDNNIRIWNANTLECLNVCVGHTEAVGCVAFSKKNLAFLVSGSKDRTIKLWEIKENADHTLSVVPRLTEKAHDKDINSIAVAPNDKIIATGSQDRTIKLWKSADLGLYGVLKGHKRGVWSVEFSPVEQCLVSSSSDKTIRIWSLTDLSCLKTFEGHTNSVLRASFITQGMQLLSSGSDGLIKLWTIKTNECVNTFDGHTDKAWALAINKGETHFISGGSDSIINIWRDYTEREQQDKLQADEEKILKEQELSNCLRTKDYKRALTLAFVLEQPMRLYGIFDELLSSGDAAVQQSSEGQDNMSILYDLISSFSVEKLEKCLLYVRDWNTNAKQSNVAQNLLRAIFKKIAPSTLQSVPQIKEILESLLPYTDRHFQRMDKLIQKSFILDYTLQRMNSVLVNGDEITTKKQRID